MADLKTLTIQPPSISLLIFCEQRLCHSLVQIIPKSESQAKMTADTGKLRQIFDYHPHRNNYKRERKETGFSASPKHGCLNVGAWNPQESGRKAPLSCNAAISMLQCSFSFAAAQPLVQMTSALQKSECCSAVSAAQHSKNCSATSVFACGMLQGWGLEGRGLGLPEF